MSNSPSRRAPFTTTGIALSAWSVLIGFAHVWGTRLVESGRNIKVFAPPLSGHFDARLTWRLLPAMALAAGAIWLGPRLARRLSWRILLAATACLAGSWSVALAFVDGMDALTIPLLRNSEYLSV